MKKRIFSTLAAVCLATSTQAQQQLYAAGTIVCDGSGTYGYVADINLDASGVAMTVTQNEPTAQRSWDLQAPSGDEKVGVRLGKLEGVLSLVPSADGRLTVTGMRRCTSDGLKVTTKDDLMAGFDELKALYEMEAPGDDDVRRWAELMPLRPPSFMYPPAEAPAVEEDLRRLVRPQETFAENFLLAREAELVELDHTTAEGQAAALRALEPYISEEIFGLEGRNLMRFDRASFTTHVVNRLAGRVQAYRLAGGLDVKSPRGEVVDYCAVAEEFDLKGSSLEVFAARVGIPEAYWSDDMINASISQLRTCDGRDLARNIERQVRRIQQSRGLISEMMAYAEGLDVKTPSLKAIYVDNVLDIPHQIDRARRRNSNVYRALVGPARGRFYNAVLENLDAEMTRFITESVKEDMTARQLCNAFRFRKFEGDEILYEKCEAGYIDYLAAKITELFDADIARIEALEPSLETLDELVASADLPSQRDFREPALRDTVRAEDERLKAAIEAKQGVYSDAVRAYYAEITEDMLNVGPVALLCGFSKHEALAVACREGRSAAEERILQEKRDIVTASVTQAIVDIKAAEPTMEDLQMIVQQMSEGSEQAIYTMLEGDMARDDTLADIRAQYLAAEQEWTSALGPAVTAFISSIDVESISELSTRASYRDLGGHVTEGLKFFCEVLDTDETICGGAIKTLYGHQQALYREQDLLACMPTVTALGLSREDAMKDLVFESRSLRSPAISLMDFVCGMPNAEVSSDPVSRITLNQGNEFMTGTLTLEEDTLVYRVDGQKGEYAHKFGIFAAYALGCLIYQDGFGGTECDIPEIR
jgi:hypothetical protein